MRGALSDQALALFAVPPEDLAGVRRAAATAAVEPELADWVGRTAADLTAATGMPSPPPALTARPEGDPDVVAYLPVLAFAETLPTTLGWAESRGISPALVAATLRDVGRMLQRNRVWFGQAGLGDELAGWLPRHLIGSLLEIGRLQHERSTPGMRTSAWLLAEGADWSPGELGVNLHIPESGPLDPVRCGSRCARVGPCCASASRSTGSASSTASRGCWTRSCWSTCRRRRTSWRFQRMFRIGPAKDDDGDASVRKFVFGNAPEPAADLPQRSSLERAAVAHWTAGRHWRVHVGRVA